ncbi:MAG: DNA gyrase subunit A [Acidobacteria bacterium]|nr:MAG: DNA gyrase subunit A [Acidobacteriota bacterium]
MEKKMKPEKSISIIHEMKEAYMDYSMSVIVGRALPDARDGLKPVHRRILYAMFREGLLSNRRFSKCAGVVGEVLKKYHPHGDSAVYDALVRLAQPWNLRYPLVDGQGNFGNIDGDRAAAYRYTEARLQALAEGMLSDIDKDTVDWQPNFDEQVQEPMVLPTRFPNLLVNGSSGIAVGMATNIPPHNLNECHQAILEYLKNPQIDNEELMQYVKGPDFPTGGIICGVDGIESAYRTGRGKVVVRAKTHFEKFDDDQRDRIVVDEIPYMVNKIRILEKIADLVRTQKVEGISEMRDESDRQGMRIVIELKRGEIPVVILNKLFQYTPLQSTFGIIMLCLVDNQPKVLNLKEMISQFVAFRKEIVIRRTNFLLRKAEARAHILEGFVKALDILDELIAMIRASKTPAEARTTMMETWDFTEIQAQAILEMRLQKLTGMERIAIVREYEEILMKIKELRAILENEEILKKVLIDETAEITKKYGDERRTVIERDFKGSFNIEDLIADEQVVLTCSNQGYIKRTPVSIYKEQRRGGKGRLGMKTHEEDFVKDIFIGSTHDFLLVFTNLGKVHRLKIHQVPQADPATRGKAIVNFIDFEKEEKPLVFYSVREFTDDVNLVFATKKGLVKKTKLSAFKHIRNAGIRAITINEGDELITVKESDGQSELLLATRMGKAIRFDEKQIRASGRTSMGVRGIKLQNEDEVVEMAIVHGELGRLLSVSANGYGKITLIDEYRTQSRAGQGLLNMRVNEKTGPIAGVKYLVKSTSVLLMSQLGKLIRMDLSNVRNLGRVTQGVRLIQLDDKSDRVIGIGLIPDEDIISEEETT